MKTYYVYFMTNNANTVLYTGVTNNLERRVYEHKTKFIKGFTEKYNCTKLVYFEETDDITVAIAREKQIKSGSRTRKNNLIRQFNPKWKDLAIDWYDL